MSKSRIPDHMTREEAAEFFDTHDFTELWDEGEPVRMRRVYDHPMQVRLDEELDRELQRFAEERGVRKSTLARMWLQERIQQERERRAS